ncbi:MAG: ABC transporter permease [Thermomicrobiales bacterium]
MHSLAIERNLSLEHRTKRRPLSRLGSLCRRRPLLVISAAIIAALIAIAAFADVIAPYDPNSISGGRLQAPNAEHRLGTDQAGRDVLSRVVVGSRMSLFIGVATALIGTSLGAVIGGYCGFIGGKLDLVTQRLIDSIQAFPTIILGLAVVAVLGPSVRNLIVALLIVFIPTSTRVIRAVALATKEREFITAARTIGAGDWRMFLRHILPQAVAPFIILISLNVGFGIVVESSLSFLGVGPPPPTVSWGGMMSGTTIRFAESAPWVLIAPGVFLSLTVYGFNLLGDSLRDMLDPRLRH